MRLTVIEQTTLDKKAHLHGLSVFLNKTWVMALHIELYRSQDELDTKLNKLDETLNTENS